MRRWKSLGLGEILSATTCVFCASQVESIRPSPSESISLSVKAAISFCIYTVLFLPGAVFEKVVDYVKGRVVIVTWCSEIVLVTQREDLILLILAKPPKLSFM